MGVMFDLFKKGTFVDNPYNNFFETKAKNLEQEVVPMSDYHKKVLLIVNVSPFDTNLKNEFENLSKLKNYFQNDDFEILAFPSGQIDNIELSDRGMKDKINSIDFIKDNIGNNKIKMFNRVYLNGDEVAEVFKYCYRNSPMFQLREGKSQLMKLNFTKFLINKNGKVYSMYTPDVEIEEIKKNIQYLMSQKAERFNIRNVFLNFNKFY